MQNKMGAAECAERLEKIAAKPANSLLIDCRTGKSSWKQKMTSDDQSAIECAAYILRKVASGEMVEVVHAEWSGIPLNVENDKYGMNKYNMRIRCTNCGFVTSSDFTHAAYCISCGAKMDKHS
jgi:hypothetical protein